MGRTAKVCDLPPCIRGKGLLAGPVISWFSSGKIKPIIYSKVYPLENAMEGLGALERRETWGKAVVRIRDEDGSKTMSKL